MRNILFILVLFVFYSSQSYTSPWAGHWSSTFGKLQFIHKETGYKDFTLVYGKYAKSGFMLGVSIDKKLYGSFYDSKSDKNGTFVFSLNQTNSAFEGMWTFDNIDKELKWNGTKLSNQNKVELTGLDRYRSIEGIWKTNFGKLKLTQDSVFVKGTYEEKGELFAVFNQTNNVMYGFFTNKNKYGLLKFQLNKEKTAFDGLWSWQTNKWTNQQWNGSKTSKLQ